VKPAVPPRVRLSIHEGGIAHVILDRAEKHNALDEPMLEAIATVAAQLADDSSVRAAVNSGAGSPA
jgi:enoyl-CoA hydratase/carnithine racemase